MRLRMKNVSGNFWQTMKMLGVYKCLWRDQQHAVTSPKWSNKKPRRKKSAVSVGRERQQKESWAPNARSRKMISFSESVLHSSYAMRAAIMAVKHVHEEIAPTPRKYCPTHFYSNKTPIWIILNKCCHITRSHARAAAAIIYLKGVQTFLRLARW